ncbi:MAG: bifunctional aspartate kinase/homoserine dehydrogenase I [Bacteroidales bacterium]|nr:bifunctional aspartate kinase/homoserine dehydrogenase I [Bacteroidales bacterium]MBR3288046.1 bifunctional aspartate kinase/homoserine dehydrogenase I [Bacteroidales bacterium]
MQVIIFGGASLGTPEAIRLVRQNIVSRKEKCVVVVSAFEDMTQRLMQLADMAVCHNDDYKVRLAKIQEEHEEIIDELVPADRCQVVKRQVKDIFVTCAQLLEGAYLLQAMPRQARIRLCGAGPILSATILSHVIPGTQYVDACDLIRTGCERKQAFVLKEETQAQIRARLQTLTATAIVAGGIGRNEDGSLAVLGRKGTDCTAAHIAAALQADVLELWINTDGFMTADPEIVQRTMPIPSMSYNEAFELSHFGASLIYAPSLQPVYLAHIPIHIRNTFNPEAEGTWIGRDASSSETARIKGVSSIPNVTMVTVQSPAIVGVSGSSKRLFDALARVSVNVILITQASSEFSITFAIQPEDTDRAVRAIREEFAAEAAGGYDFHVTTESDLSIIAVVGEQMKNMPGVAATLFKALARNGISAVAVAQGSSELNISIAIRKDALRKALNVIHEDFFITMGFKTLHLFQVGTGTVGNSLLKQIGSQRDILMERHKLKINIIGVANIDKMLFDLKGIPGESYDKEIEQRGEPIDLDKFVERIKALNLRNSVFVDCTASPVIASKYETLLDNFISVVTPNKIACSSAYSRYENLKRMAKERGVRFLYETNVGAGLPIINTMNDLILSGDKILRIEAVLSGTLNFIFNTISSEIPLSQTIRLAKEQGYSEPDPRIDLSGTDVVRKILILSREAGCALEKEDIVVNKFLPDDCFEGTLDDFWKKVPAYDAQFEQERRKIEQEHKRWRFVAVFENGQASVGLRTVDQCHPAYNLEGSNNIILITTERYKELPMVIKGYGAGAEVTAAGVFADVIRVANL